MREFGSQEELGVDDDLTFMEPCRWSGCLYDLGAFPGAVPGDGTVHGELFRLESETVWDVLDRYEGYDPNREAASLFVRRQVSLSHPSVPPVWVYWYNGAVADSPRVPSGDWGSYVAD